MRTTRRSALAGLTALASSGPSPAATNGLASRAHAWADTVLAARDAGQGAIVSPLNLLEAVAPLVLASFAGAETALERIYADRPGTADPLADFAALSRGIRSESLSHASAVWLDRGSPASPRMVAALRQRAGADVGNLSFRDKASVAVINDWVSARTHGLIPAILDRIPDGSAAVITAALYFAARWAQAFDPAMTRPAPFRRSDGSTVTAPFMRIKAEADMAEGPELTALRLPYADAAFEFVAVIPRDGQPRNLVPAIASRGSLLRTIDALSFRPQPPMDIYLPRLAVQDSADLLPALRKGPAAPAFAPHANLSGLTGEALQIGAVQFKAELRMDETGTTAAAATAVVAERSLILNAPVFRADMPFLAAVRHRKSRLLIVAALVDDPNTKMT